MVYLFLKIEKTEPIGTKTEFPTIVEGAEPEEATNNNMEGVEDALVIISHKYLNTISFPY